MQKGVDLSQVADVGRFFQCVLPNGSNIDVLDRSMGQLLGLVDGSQAVEAIVGDLGDSDVSLPWIGQRVSGKSRLGEHAKERCLAHLGQANDSGFHKKQLSAVSSQHSAHTVGLGGGDETLQNK